MTKQNSDDDVRCVVQRIESVDVGFRLTAFATMTISVPSYHRFILEHIPAASARNRVHAMTVTTNTTSKEVRTVMIASMRN